MSEDTVGFRLVALPGGSTRMLETLASGQQRDIGPIETALLIPMDRGLALRIVPEKGKPRIVMVEGVDFSTRLGR